MSALPGLMEFFKGRPLPRGMVFDLDDTLYLQADYKRSAFAAVGEKLEGMGLCTSIEAVSALEAVLKEHGPSYGLMFNHMAGKLGLDPSLVPVLVETLRAHRPSIGLFPGVPDMLVFLKGKVRLGLLTDGLGRVQRAKIDALDVRKYFDLVVLSDDHKTSKPDGMLFALFEDAFSLKGGELAYVADNPSKDFIGANKRGWTTIRVRTGEHARDGAEGLYEADTSAPVAADVLALFAPP